MDIGASIIKIFGSMGYEQDLWEMCVLIFENKEQGPYPYEFAYHQPVFGNNNYVGGCLTDEDVLGYLGKIREINTFYNENRKK